jgi:hypothetical protein
VSPPGQKTGRRLNGSNLFRIRFKLDNEPFPAPELNVMAVHQASGVGYGLGIVAADERPKSYEMPVITNYVGAIIRHRCSSERTASAPK